MTSPLKKSVDLFFHAFLILSVSETSPDWELLPRLDFLTKANSFLRVRFVGCMFPGGETNWQIYPALG